MIPEAETEEVSKLQGFASFMVAPYSDIAIDAMGNGESRATHHVELCQRTIWFAPMVWAGVQVPLPPVGVGLCIVRRPATSNAVRIDGHYGTGEAYRDG
jgi:hypothetical protein